MHNIPGSFKAGKERGQDDDWKATLKYSIKAYTCEGLGESSSFFKIGKDKEISYK